MVAMPTIVPGLLDVPYRQDLIPFPGSGGTGGAWSGGEIHATASPFDAGIFIYWIMQEGMNDLRWDVGTNDVIFADWSYLSFTFWGGGYAASFGANFVANQAGTMKVTANVVSSFINDMNVTMTQVVLPTVNLVPGNNIYTIAGDPSEADVEFPEYGGIIYNNPIGLMLNLYIQFTNVTRLRTPSMTYPQPRLVSAAAMAMMVA